MASRPLLQVLKVELQVTGECGTFAGETIRQATSQKFSLAMGGETMKSLLLGAACACLVGSNLAHAAPVTWTLNNVAFADEGTAIGSFVFDADTNEVTSWSISVAGGDSTTFPPFIYESDGNQFSDVFSNALIDQYFSFNDLPPAQDTRLIRIGPSQPLTNSGGTVVLDVLNTNFNVETVNSISRLIVSGSVSAVPLPAAFPLLASGLIGLMGIARRRQAASGALKTR
jgi:hypothetical protein